MSRTRVVEPWLAGPLEHFVSESGARLTLILTPAGQVLAQHGFTRAVDVMSAAALASGIAASTGELARLLEGGAFRALSHESQRHGVFLSRFASPRGPLLALVVYGYESSIGLVQLFFEELVTDLAAAAPAAPPRAPVLAADFERELNESLATLFR
ncbi:MAG: roadblock/LC7 domain-containing protein [Gemmatimonadota bacterium]|nr:roadblock/LC7 domain-containing protein [Gemmatimonadota bacterium]